MAGAAPVIHIGGWPGAGKRTIGRLVAFQLGARMIDNHLMLDAACAIYERGTPGSAQLREDVREVVLRHALKLPLDVPLVLTDALADEPEAEPLFKPTLDLARDRNAPLLTFVLDLSVPENLRRLTDPSRGGAKLRDASILKTIRETQKLFFPVNAVRVDVTDLSAQEAADAICACVKDHNA